MPLSPPLQQQLLDWYQVEGRSLPWRVRGKPHPDPYQVWLSEIMLQQTTVATVHSYFERFLKRWPSVGALARASLDEVLHAWQGLGYYHRARNLHRCAQTVVEMHHGQFPRTVPALEKLPGVGPYTARAIASIAYGEPVIPVDGNVVRVIARLTGLQTKPPTLIEEVRQLTTLVTSLQSPHDFVQALMDLGATLCTPQNPVCAACPWNASCVAKRKGLTDRIPVKKDREEKPVRRMIAWVVQNREECILLRKRAEKGLLAGLWEVPSTERAAEDPQSGEGDPKGMLRHSFTHFHLDVEVRTIKKEREEKDLGGVWISLERLKDFALPTLTKKILEKAGFRL